MKGDKLKLKLIGGFQLLNQQGEPIDVASKKGRVLLAILAVAENGERSRAWLQETLWSRGSGQDSLRRELASLRRLFEGSGVDPLPKSVPRDVIRLQLDCFEIDVHDIPASSEGIFLEGLSITHDENIEAWLTSMRARYLPAPVVSEGDPPAKTDYGQPGTSVEKPVSKDVVFDRAPSIIDPSSRTVRRTGVAIHPVVWEVSDRLKQKLRPYVNDTVSRIGRVLLGSGGIDIIDLSIDAMMPDMTRMPLYSGIAVKLVFSVDEMYSGIFLRAHLLEAATSRVLCTRRCEIDVGLPGACGSPEFVAKKFVAESADEILFAIVRLEQSSSTEEASVIRLIHEGVEGMFQLSNSGLDQARERFDLAIEHMPDSITHAWRAYLCTQLIDDARISDVDQLRAEARFHSAKALEYDRYNPLTRSLLTHVHSFALHEFEVAAENMQMAKDMHSDHLMTYDADALLQMYLGKLDVSREAALQASNLGRMLPYRYLFLTSLCMVESLAGNFEQSIIAGEHALKLHPLKADRVYPPVVRYLTESYARSGAKEKSNALVESFKADGKLSLEALARRGRPSQDIDKFLQISMSLVK